MDLVALFAITVTGVACFLLMVSGFWIAPWLMVTVLVSLLFFLLRIPLFSQDDSMGVGEDPTDSNLNFWRSPLGLTQNSTLGSQTKDDNPSLSTKNNPLIESQKGLSYRGAKYNPDLKATENRSIEVITYKGQYRGNPLKLITPKPKQD